MAIWRDKERARRLAASIGIEGRCCERCGPTDRIERHHPDYRKPLVIEVLCKPCHAKEDGWVHAKDAWKYNTRAQWERAQIRRNERQIRRDIKWLNAQAQAKED